MNEDKKLHPRHKKAKNYMKYAGMAFQFFALILIAALIGQKLDSHFETSKPFITIFLIIFFSTGYFYKLYKDLFG